MVTDFISTTFFLFRALAALPFLVVGTILLRACYFIRFHGYRDEEFLTFADFLDEFVAGF